MKWDSFSNSRFALISDDLADSKVRFSTIYFIKEKCNFYFIIKVSTHFSILFLYFHLPFNLFIFIFLDDIKGFFCKKNHIFQYKIFIKDIKRFESIRNLIKIIKIL